MFLQIISNKHIDTYLIHKVFRRIVAGSYIEWGSVDLGKHRHFDTGIAQHLATRKTAHRRKRVRNTLSGAWRLPPGRQIFWHVLYRLVKPNWAYHYQVLLVIFLLKQSDKGAMEKSQFSSLGTQFSWYEQNKEQKPSIGIAKECQWLARFDSDTEKKNHNTPEDICLTLRWTKIKTEVKTF